MRTLYSPVVVVLLHLCTRANGQSSTLRFVHAIWRHGDRSPGGALPTDPRNNESSWPQGFGELSTIGARQQFELGVWLRHRYAQFVQSRYDAKEIYIRSTDYNRTLMSAQANLAGFYYPPDAEQRFLSDLTWQPIPVHTVPREMDYKLWLEADCPTEQALYIEYLKSEPAQRITEKYRDFIIFLSEKADVELNSIEDVWIIFDPLFCEKAWNDRDPGSHPWPEWVNETVFQKLDTLYKISWEHYYPTDQILRFRGGPLLNEIVTRMQDKAANAENVQNLKYYAYSAHDTITAALLMTLGAYSSPPTYASLVLIELHEVDGQFHVELFYRNSSSSEPYKLEISGCPSPCSLSKLAEAKAHLFPKDWHAECGLRPFYLAYASLIQGLLCLLVLILAVLLVAVSVAHWRYTRRHRADLQLRQQLENMDDDSDDGLEQRRVESTDGQQSLLA